MIAAGQDVLTEMRDALTGTDWRIEAVLTFTHGPALQVYARPSVTGRYRKVGPLLITNTDESLADTLAMLADLMREQVTT